MAKQTTETPEPTQAMTTTNGRAGALDIPAEEGSGLSGEFDRGDLVLPICSIVQPTSKSEKGEAGMFSWNSGRQAESFQAVTLNIVGTRAMWSPVGKDPEGMVCRSGDRRNGYTKYPSLVFGADAAYEKGYGDIEDDGVIVPCELCPHQQDDQFSSADYLCKKGYTLLLYDTAEGEAFLFFVKGKAMSTVTKRIVSPALFRVQRKEPPAPWRTPFFWETFKNETKKGKFWTPNISPLPPLADEDAARYEAMAYDLSDRAAAQTLEDDLPIDAEQGEFADA